MHKITFSKDADKALRRMPRNQAVIIAKKIKKLAINPGFRLRVGDWRIVYTVNDTELLIHVVNVKPRGEVYK